MFFVKRLFLLLPLVGLLSSCSEDFEVAAPYKPVTVIYGFMNVSDTAHYIRIQKAFLDENKSALDMARVPDSNYYASLSVHLKEFSGPTLLADETLQRVDLTKEGYPKEAGPFFNDSNFAYKSKRTLTSGFTYRLVVTNAVTGEVDSAETPIIGVVGTEFLVSEFYNSYILDFRVALEANLFELNLIATSNAQIFEGIIRFHYVDSTASGGHTDDSVDWHFAMTSRDEEPPRLRLKVPQRSFYYFLRDNIGPAPANVERYMGRVDMFVWAGSADFANYQKINGAQGGLTSDQIKPLYTNIKGANVLGLFTTRARREIHRIPISEITLDSLIKNPITSALKIRGRSDR